jgi:DNA-directed RNA polymerase specialized sigma24 family protein
MMGVPKFKDEASERAWPAIESAYADEYGQIQLEVYMTAGAIREKVERFAQATLQDPQVGSRLLFRAAALVSLKMADGDTHIEDLKGYLFQTYKNLVLHELRKENRRKEIQTEHRNELDSLSINVAEDVDRKILLEQIVRHMDPWLRRVYEWRCLDYDFDLIAKSLGEKSHVVRSKYSKKLMRLIKQINQATEQAAKNVRKHTDPSL